MPLHGRFDFRTGGKSKQAGFLRRDRPQIRLLLAQPIKKNGAFGSPCDLLSVQWRRPGRSSLRQQSQAFGQSTGAAVVGPSQSVVCLPARDEKMTVVVVDARSVGEERKLRVFMLHGI